MTAEIEQLIENLAPEQALAALAQAARKLLAHLDEQARVDFVVNMIGEAGHDKVASMVDL